MYFSLLDVAKNQFANNFMADSLWSGGILIDFVMVFESTVDNVGDIRRMFHQIVMSVSRSQFGINICD